MPDLCVPRAQVPRQQIRAEKFVVIFSAVIICDSPGIDVNQHQEQFLANYQTPPDPSTDPWPFETLNKHDTPSRLMEYLPRPYRKKKCSLVGSQGRLIELE